MENQNKMPDGTPPIERLAFTAEEVRAALGGISHVTLWRLQSRKLLRPVPGLRHRLYSRDELNRFLSGRAMEELGAEELRRMVAIEKEARQKTPKK